MNHVQVRCGFPQKPQVFGGSGKDLWALDPLGHTPSLELGTDVFAVICRHRFEARWLREGVWLGHGLKEKLEAGTFCKRKVTDGKDLGQSFGLPRVLSSLSLSVPRNFHGEPLICQRVQPCPQGSIPNSSRQLMFAPPGEDLLRAPFLGVERLVRCLSVHIVGETRPMAVFPRQTCQPTHPHPPPNPPPRRSWARRGSFPTSSSPPGPQSAPTGGALWPWAALLLASSQQEVPLTMSLFFLGPPKNCKFPLWFPVQAQAPKQTNPFLKKT